MKWFLIPEDVVKEIQKYLINKEDAKDVLHDFETSLNKTTEIPDDFKSEDVFLDSFSSGIKDIRKERKWAEVRINIGQGQAETMLWSIELYNPKTVALLEKVCVEGNNEISINKISLMAIVDSATEV